MSNFDDSPSIKAAVEAAIAKGENVEEVQPAEQPAEQPQSAEETSHGNPDDQAA